MKKVMQLVRIQLWAVIGDMLAIGKVRKKKTGIIYAGVVFFVFLMSSISFFYSMMIGTGLKMYDSLDSLPAMMISVTCVILLMTTIFKVKGTIFGFKDYDMVMSFPVSTGVIVASRLIILYALNFLFVIILLVPMILAYGILAQPSAMFYVLGLIAIFFVPLVPIVAASVLGTVIAYVASRFRHSNLLNIIFTLGLMGVIVSFSFSISDNGQEMVDMGKALTNQMNKAYPLAGMFTDAVVNYDYASFGLFLGISIGAFLLYILVVMKLFKKINTLMLTGRSGVNFKMGRLKTSSQFKALYTKELKRYFSSSLYVTNTGFGVVMLTIAAIALLFVDLEKIFAEPEMAAYIADYGLVLIVFCVIMSCSTMASISLEGKSLWIIKSMPIAPKTVYLAKATVNLTILSPVLIDTIIIGVALNSDFLLMVLMLLNTVACAVLISFYGLLINLLLPNLNWVSEVVAIKQSAATLVTVFTSMAYVVILIVLIAVVPSLELAYLCFFLLTSMIDGFLYLLLMTYGKRRYTQL